MLKNCLLKPCLPCMNRRSSIMLEESLVPKWRTHCCRPVKGFQFQSWEYKINDISPDGLESFKDEITNSHSTLASNKYLLMCLNRMNTRIKVQHNSVTQVSTAVC
jgi:hypothetical protein